MNWLNSTLALRLVLLGGGLLFICGLIWLDRRRRRQAGGNELQTGAGTEEAEPLPETVARPEPGTRTEPAMSDLRAASTRRPLPVIDWQSLDHDPAGANESGPTLAVHGLRSAALDIAPVRDVDVPAMVTPPHGDADDTAEWPAQPLTHEEPVAPLAPYDGEPSIDHWPPEATRRICSLRIAPSGVERLSGRVVRQALQGAGFIHGPMGIFHHVDAQGRALISAANLARPGQLELATMDFQRLGGLHLFTVLPGPLPDRELLQQLFSLAAELADRIDGILQDDRGMPLTAARRQELLNQYSGPQVGQPAAEHMEPPAA